MIADWAAAGRTNNEPGPRVYSGVDGSTVSVAVAGERDEESPDARLRRLFDTQHTGLYRLARRMVRTPDEARDLVQETFLRMARAPATVPPGESSEQAWLVRVMVNLCRDEWRKRAIRQRLNVQHLADTRTPAPSNPEAAFIAQTTIWRALETLAPRRRAAIVLYELEGVGIPEIARQLGVSAVTVRWHLSRGRRELARTIGNSAPPGERGPS